MERLGLNEIRRKFLNFFESKGHLVLPSYSLIPENDKSLLLIAAGMAPLKAYFTGQETPPQKRIATCQKCIRTVDIENVGKTSRHGDFFEMLGNFSFGDYFKEEIIPWAWEFVTKELGLPEDRLYVSVYEEDDEAYEIWNKKVGLSTDKIVRLGKHDNFWEHGTGPCGPCSEIHFDRGEEYGCGNENCAVGCSCDRFIEIWNLVFTQFDKGEDGVYRKLSKPNIDTGMGLERVAYVMQNVPTIFDVDTIAPIRDEVCNIAGAKYNSDSDKDISVRIITDHIRSVTFMTADGVLPSNESRGYVLRRLLRRAALHGKLLGIKGAFLTELSGKVIEVAKEAYPELEEKKEYIFKVLSVEENRFHEMIGQGMEILKKFTANSTNKILSGSDAFKLYDTYGFPLDLMKEILAQSGIVVDEEKFNEEMRLQKERGRAAREDTAFGNVKGTVYNKLDIKEATIFTGYDSLETKAEIVALIADDEVSDKAMKGDSIVAFLNKTPLYAEGGGQKGDKGFIRTETGVIQIDDCTKVLADKYAHKGTVIEGFVLNGAKADVEVVAESRLQTARNHSATHLLQKALKEVLGNHVEQAGSLVSAERLRFDFTHFEPVGREELDRVSDIVNEKILESIDISVAVKPIDEARAMGATALFGEKYGTEVRVVSMGGYSIELCGGTHLKNTSQIGMFKIVSETGIAQGVRRIEALTGKAALDNFRNIEESFNLVCQLAHSTPDAVVKKVENLVNREKELVKEVNKLKSSKNSDLVNEMINSLEVIDGVNTIMTKVTADDMNALKAIGDKIKDKIKSGVLVLASGTDKRVDLLVMVTDDVVKKGINSGTIIREISPIIGGKGGGRPNMAQAGGKDSSKIDEALQKAVDVVKNLLKK